MITSLTLKAITAVATATVLAVFSSTMFTQSIEVSHEPKIQITENDTQRLNDTNFDQQQPLLVEFIPPVPIEIPEPVEVYDVVVYAPEIIQSTVTITRDEIISISRCGWTCNGGCGVVYCSYEIIEEQPVEEEEESILSEQFFVDPYLFEAKTYPNPTRDNATIELDIELSGNFTIQLFDMNGRMVKQIYDGHLESGRQSFNTDLYDYMPGLYFISIQSLFQQETLKVQKI